MKIVALFLVILLPSLLSGQTVRTSTNTLLRGKKILPYDTARAQFVITSSSTAMVTCVISGLHFPFEVVGDSVIFLAPLSSDTVTVLITPTDVR